MLQHSYIIPDVPPDHYWDGTPSTTNSLQRVTGLAQHIASVRRGLRSESRLRVMRNSLVWELSMDSCRRVTPGPTI